MNITHRSLLHIASTSLPVNCQTEPKLGKYLKTTEKKIIYASF